MSENVISLARAQLDAKDVVKGLRNAADLIERGEIDFPITTAVLVIGHTDTEYAAGEVLMQENHWTTFGFGPRADSFTVRGLLMTAINRWCSDE